LLLNERRYGRNRTAVPGFADPCLSARPHSYIEKSSSKNYQTNNQQQQDHLKSYHKKLIRLVLKKYRILFADVIFISSFGNIQVLQLVFYPTPILPG
jgi:hypothetical protein